MQVAWDESTIAQYIVNTSAADYGSETNLNAHMCNGPLARGPSELPAAALPFLHEDTVHVGEEGVSRADYLRSSISYEQCLRMQARPS